MDEGILDLPASMMGEAGEAEEGNSERANLAIDLKPSTLTLAAAQVEEEELGHAVLKAVEGEGEGE